MTKAPTFEDLFRSCRQSAVHLEMRDGYMRSDPAFIDWAAGKAIDPAERWRGWLDIVREATDRGVAVRRARIVSEPVSDYIRFEHSVTDGLNINAGEEVGWLPRRQATALALPGNDFWVFDDKAALINHFDGDGESLQHEYVESPQLVSFLSSAFKTVWENVVPHAQYRLV
ncbi:hypothetical protein SSP35_01_01870 [Streptomyces sp. NBRC 110611]|uniref:DUF6879 family protein n=1 Tax=Streptomyces sp. NBRC 110611 TaxID=1621259 RepID=UPI000855DABC|nr:DUF6879 family protein [Streptomyces sp. NBRC 110611]GAU64851.1 hypothetical protein SSP35_01_01870 [Streptomyces sp. NBRC 110611]